LSDDDVWESAGGKPRRKRERECVREEERKNYFVLGCDAMQLGENRRFERKSPPSSGLNSKSRKKPTEARGMLSLLGFPFDPEDGSNMFFRNVWLSLNTRHSNPKDGTLDSHCR
jgi:hypothetical protein